MKTSLITSTTLLAFFFAACGGNDSSGGNDGVEKPSGGSDSGLGGDDGSGGDDSDSGGSDSGSGGDDGTGGDSKSSGGRVASTGTGGAQGNSTSGGGDTGSGGDLGMGGASSGPFPTTPDYLLCERDDDCPNTVDWECVTSLALNQQAQDGTTSVAVADLLPGETGVCSRDCSSDPDICSALNYDALEGTAPFTCQVVWSEVSPYPSDENFPFSDSIDSDAMDVGQAFAAVCRPPVELDAGSSSTFCGACTSAADCTSGEQCWNPLTGDADATDDGGICAAPCDADADCLLGFLCEPIESDGNFCVPAEGTCSSCADHDGDGRGVGHCDEVEVDCDDSNPDAYWDQDDPKHPFPAHCGDFDYNCNGKSDADEQLVPVNGVLEFGANHCGTCGSTCAGAVDNAVKSCVPTADNLGSQCIAACGNYETHASCDGNPNTGCETNVTDPSALYYPDIDGDSFGDRNASPEFACSGNIPYDTDSPPKPKVNDHSDCDDTASAVKPSATEVCDGIDNDCDDDIDADDAGAGLVTATYYPDVDGDNFGDEDSPIVQCSEWIGASPDPRGNVLDGTDCDDSRIAVSPAAFELCSTAYDDNCDDSINEDSAIDAYTYYVDGDGDGYPKGTGSAFQATSCADSLEGYTRNPLGDSDCKDGNPDIHPDALEICDGKNNNCVDGTDESYPEEPVGDVYTACVDDSRVGACQQGEVTACSGGELVCTQTVFEEFDDPLTPYDSGTPNNDEDCDGEEAPIYVDPGANTGGNGSKVGPYKSLGDAIAAIEGGSHSGSDAIYLLGDHAATSAYTIDESLEIQDGIDIVGGFDADWGFSSVSNTTTIIQTGALDTSGRVVGVRGVSISSRTTLAYLTIEVSAPSRTLAAGQSGANLVGMLLHNADELNLHYVDIHLAQAESGAAATAVGVDGTEGPDGQRGSALNFHTCQYFAESNGVYSEVEVEVSGGLSFIGAGGAGVHSLSSSWAGTAGNHAPKVTLVSDGASFGPATSFSTVNWTYATQYAEYGYPGGGGGGGYTNNPTNQPASAGAGACGGTIGANGGHGGSRIGILAYLSEGLTMNRVTVDLDEFQAGAGGAGTAGGDGARGGTRGTGDSGTVAGGSGGGSTGAGGGAGGHAGHVIGLISFGSSLVCDDLAATEFAPGALPLQALGGPGGDGGEGGLHGRSTSSTYQSADGEDGADGADGATIACHDSTICSSDADCSGSNVCVTYSGGKYCVPNTAN